MRVSVGIAGFGTIGSGVVHLLRHNARVIAEKTGIELSVAAVADVAFQERDGISLEGVRRLADGMELVKDPEIDIIVELVGGVAFPEKLLRAAFAAGKHVVTANKALLAKHGASLFAAAAAAGKGIGFEASVAGGIPIIKAIRESLVGNRILEIRGIINGTCNYIMTKMSEEGLPFGEALAAAQRLGFAEADPTLDISGGDASHKIAILAALAFNTPVEHEAVHCEGIERIDQADIRYAAELGYVVRLIAIARDRGEEGFEARVHPMLVPLHDQLAGIRNEFNAVFVRSDYMGDGMFTGRGAGSFPTASAVVADIVDIAGRIRDGLAATPLAANWRPRRLLPFEDSENRAYLRFTTLDQPGILSRISGILGRHGISIASVKQAESADPAAVPLVMVTHHARERDLRLAVAEIDQLDIIRRPTVSIRAL